MMEDVVVAPKPVHTVTNRILALGGVAGIAVGVLAVGYFNPVSAGFFPGCPLHDLTGLNCPGCGLTRGFHALFNGDIPGALHYNLLLPFFSFVFGYLVISLLLTAIRGRGLSWRIFSPTVVWILLAMLISFGVLRNLPFYPFNLLAI